MPRKIRKQSELQAACTHLHYEIKMFRMLGYALLSGIAKDGWLSDALLECFLLHTRCLIDFLYNDNPKEDDIVAGDYFDSQHEWAASRPRATELLIDTKQRINKELSHLTYRRIDTEFSAKDWPIASIVNDLSLALDKFVHGASPNCLSGELFSIVR